MFYLGYFRELLDANMAVGGGFFDQYSVFCVFGSVVGCVVVPLITQSVESVIFSAIVISLTATHLTKRSSKSESSNQVSTKDIIEKRSSRKSKDREQLAHAKKRKQMTQQLQPVAVRVPDVRKQKEENQKKIDLARRLELERKQEEKRERQIKRKEERLKRKELEKEEREKEEQRLKLYKEQRQKEMRENLKQTDKRNCLQRVDSVKTRLASATKTTKKLDTPSSTHKTSVKVPSSPLLTMQYLSRQRSQSEGSESEPPSPPPSVWKVPVYVEPKWNPGKPEAKGTSKEMRLNNDVVCTKVKPQAPFNQLYNPVHMNQSFQKNQLINQCAEKNQNPGEFKPSFHAAEFTKVKEMDKPDNRQVKFTPYSSFSGLDLLSQLKEDSRQPESEVRPYSLFGPDEPNSTIFRSPLTGH